MDIDYDKLVEELEEVEDTVECKVCFDLFPKEVCFKTPLGWVCPVCKQEMISHEGNSLDLINATPEDIKYQDPRLPEKVEEKEVLEEPVDGDAIRKHENGIAEDFELPTTVRVADVEYNDDDKVDYHVLVYAGDADADEIEEILYEAGMIFVYVNDIYEKSIPVADLDKLKIGDVLEVLDESMKEYYRHNQETLEDKTELKGGDCAVVDCQTDHKIIAHSEDEKPLDCLMKKPPLEKPLTEGIFEDICDGLAVLYNRASELYDKLNIEDDVNVFVKDLSDFYNKNKDNLPVGTFLNRTVEHAGFMKKNFEKLLLLLYSIKEGIDIVHDKCTDTDIDESLKEELKPEDQYWVIVINSDNGDNYSEDGFDTYEEAKEFYESIKTDPEYDWDIQVQLYTPEGDMETYEKIGGIVEGSNSVAREYAAEITAACLDALDKGEFADKDLKGIMAVGNWEVLRVFAEEMHPEFKDKFSVVDKVFDKEGTDEEVEKIIYAFCDELENRYPDYVDSSWDTLSWPKSDLGLATPDDAGLWD